MRKNIVMLVLFLSVVSYAIGSQSVTDAYFTTAETFMNYLSAENFPSAEEMLTDQMMQAMPLNKLEALWKNVEGQFGKFVKIANMKSGKSGNYTVVVANVEFQKGYLDFKIVLDNSLKVAGLWISRAETPKYKLPKYVDLSKFTIKEVKIGNKWKLPAELTIPKGKGPFPAVVLIPGSGPSDMNEKIGEDEPFKDIAYGLSTMGIAVLRYDKRAHVYGSEMTKLNQLNVENIYLQDASNAIKFMENEPFTDELFIIGHSLGAYLLPEIAKENPGIAGMIMLAAPARPLADVMVDQLEYISKLSPNNSDLKALLSEMKLIKEHELNENKFVFGAPASYYYELEKYKPIEILKKLSKPVLICQGGKDYQVTSKDFDMFKDAFQSNSLFTFKWYPNLSHIFTPVVGVPSPANYDKPSNVSKEVIQGMANWIEKR